MRRGMWCFGPRFDRGDDDLWVVLGLGGVRVCFEETKPRPAVALTCVPAACPPCCGRPSPAVVVSFGLCVCVVVPCGFRHRSASSSPPLAQDQYSKIPSRLLITHTTLLNHAPDSHRRVPQH